MDTLPLPPRPDLAQYRKRAKELVKASASAEPAAVRAWSADWLETLARLRGVTVSPFVQGSFDRAVEVIEQRVRERSTRGRFTLADAQFLMARAHGFASWRDFAGHVEGLCSDGAGGDPFEHGADAVVTGDLPRLESLLRDHPDLVRARSAREHRATLLHYVAANGVEDFRQLTPPNAVEIATSLLAAGAAVDALAETYGGGTAQTTMNLLVSSVHPAVAGLQPALIEILLDFGAAIDGLDDDGSPLMTALAFGYVQASEALVSRGARIDNVLAAAALGRVELVERILAEDRGVSRSLVDLYWLRLSSDPQLHVERAFVWACAFGRVGVVELLLAHGVDPGVTDDDGMTGRHLAAARGHLEVMKLLIERGAPLEARNRWGGTVLDSTAYFVLQHPADWPSFAHAIELLVAAGADVQAVLTRPGTSGSTRCSNVTGRADVCAGSSAREVTGCRRPSVAARCGGGRCSEPAGIDASEQLVRIAAERTPEGDFRSGDMEALPWGDDSFDVVTGNSSFQFADDKVRALREAAVSRGARS